MNWATEIIIAGIINGFVNFGYKTQAAKGRILLVAAWATGLNALLMLAYYVHLKAPDTLSDLLLPTQAYLVTIAMGVGSAVVLIFALSAYKKGPYSIIDPLWACVYTCISLVLGLTILKEKPGWAALVGVGLYLVSTVLMSRARQRRLSVPKQANTSS
jgi:drug/metabolite transporter (DMT)-like permease